MAANSLKQSAGNNILCRHAPQSQWTADFIAYYYNVYNVSYKYMWLDITEESKKVV